MLHGIDLAVGAGEIVGIFGRNGVGKTTMLKTIAGWVAAIVRHDPLRRRRTSPARSPDRIFRKGIGFIPEDRRIFPGADRGGEPDARPASARGRAEPSGAPRSTGDLDRFPRLGERRRQLGTTLSGGEQQMLAIARVLIGKPKLLLVDEPSEGLAPMIVNEIYAILRS